MIPVATSIAEIYQWLEEVKDPEIPVLSLVDLGVITEVAIDGQKVKIELTPTFAGCPAMEVMKSEIIEKLKSKGIPEVEVQISFRVPWSSEFISEKGKKALKKYGFAPPPSNKLFTDLEILETAICPRCDGTNTIMKSPFGPTLCRSIYYCNDCKEAFEQFKPL
ncbi:MAG: 1,2-phenylacetyl-CoA epoxidase subunit PaaD [Cyclobacteriaceae bacterium]|jgi:ring-1,2-phenylacetyl-CoA epoxidase subunit PaaD|nr:phenylacetate-CoA oxygenase subunit PaaJ [Flammeovirgaceae bacterium]